MNASLLLAVSDVLLGLKHRFSTVTRRCCPFVVNKSNAFGVY